MNKNDFEILSPTSKQKTEMKERLMKEAMKEENKPFWQDFSFYVKIAASLVLVVGVVAIIGLIINSNGTGVDILLPPASKPVISDIPSESEDSSGGNTENQPSEKLSVRIYHCGDVNRTDDTKTHGSASITLFMEQYNLELKDYQVFLCEDGCEKSDIVSRASQGNAPMYNITTEGEIDGDPKAIRFRMTIPESMVEGLKEQNNYESVIQRLDSNYYYLIELSEKHYAYIHLARKKDSGKAENEVADADAIIKNARFDLNSDTSSETESNVSSDTSSDVSEPEPYVSDIGSFDRSGVLYKKPVIENEKIKVEVNDLYYEKETLILSYAVTNKGSEELDIGTFTAGMGDYSDVFINGYGLLNEDTYSENITAQLSKEKLDKGDTAEVRVEVRYDALLSVGISNVSEIRTALYYGRRWNEDEVDFEEYETVYIEARTSIYDKVGIPAIRYEEQLKNEAVQKKTGYTLLKFIDTPFDEQNGIVIENVALLKTKSDTDGMEHYTVRLTIHNVSDNTVKFYTAVYLMNDVLTAMVGANHPGNDIPADGRLILDVNTRSLGELAHYGITDIRKIRLHSRTGVPGSELEEFSTDIKFGEDAQSEPKQELYNGNGVIITAEKLYEQYECGNIVLLFDTANSIKTFSFTGNVCTINGKEFVIGQNQDEIHVGSSAWDAPVEGSVRKPFVLSIPMELYDEIDIASASEIEEIAVELTIYKADGSAEKPIITIRP